MSEQTALAELCKVSVDAAYHLRAQQTRIAYLENMIREALDRLDLGAPGRAREILIEALGK